MPSLKSQFVPPCDDLCDEEIDYGFVLTNDEANCGVCGHTCGAGQACDNGHCAWISPPPGCTSTPEIYDNVDNMLFAGASGKQPLTRNQRKARRRQLRQNRMSK